MDASVAALKSLASQENIQELCKAYNVDDFMKIGSDAVPSCLLDKSTQANLFPEDTISVFFEPYRVLPSNLEYILHTSEGNMTSSGNKVKAVSFLTEVQNGDSNVRVDLDVYTNASVSEEEQEGGMRQHVIKALLLDRPKYQACANLVFTFCIPNFVDIDATKQWMTENFQGVKVFIQEVAKYDQFIVCEYDWLKWRACTVN